MDYDRARPGATTLHVALERLLRQEANRTTGRHGVTVLMDMRIFYGTIDLTKLQQQALALESGRRRNSSGHDTQPRGACAYEATFRPTILWTPSW